MLSDLLANDSVLKSKPLGVILGLDKETESGWATMYNNEGDTYRVHIAEKVAEAKERKIAKHNEETKKQQSAEEKKKFDVLMGKLKTLSQGKEKIKKIAPKMKSMKDAAVIAFASSKTQKDFSDVLEYVKNNNIQDSNEVREYMAKTGVDKRYKEFIDKAFEINDKIFKDKYFNFKIYTYKNGDKAVFVDSEKIVLNDDEYDFIKTKLEFFNNPPNYKNEDIFR